MKKEESIARSECRPGPADGGRHSVSLRSGRGLAIGSPPRIGLAVDVEFDTKARLRTLPQSPIHRSPRSS